MIPKDPVMLLSFINTNLRDHYDSFDDLINSLNLDGKAITETLKTIDYIYDEGYNQFR